MNVYTELTPDGIVARCDDGHIMRYEPTAYVTGRWVHRDVVDLVMCKHYEGEQAIIPVTDVG